MKITLANRSSESGFQHLIDIYLPEQKISRPLPILIAPHPFSWTSEQDYSGGLPDLKRNYHRGYLDLASKYEILIAMPHGHPRCVENASLAYPPQIQDLARIPEQLSKSGFSIDWTRIYACGLSMGGQEALVLSGTYPELIAAVVAFNPIIDLAAWQEDMEMSPIPEITASGTANNIMREVGGLPKDVPDRYYERSVLAYSDGLARVPALIFWSELDVIVPRQESHHTGKLMQIVRSHHPYNSIVTYNHTRIHGIEKFSPKECWQLHEWCDYEWAIQWLLQHNKQL